MDIIGFGRTFLHPPASTTEGITGELIWKRTLGKASKALDGFHFSLLVL